MPALDRDRVRVLMVECEAEVRLAAGDALERTGFELLEWEGSWAELNGEVWEQLGPDVVLVGAMADEVEQRVSEVKTWPAPVVHVVHGGEVERISMVLAEDAGECVVWPFGRDQLVISVQATLTRRALREHRSAEERRQKLQPSEARSEIGEGFLQALNALPQAVMVADMVGCVIVVNRVAADWLGYGVKELVGRRLTEVCRVTSVDGDQEADWLGFSGRSSEGKVDQLKLLTDDGEALLVEGSRSILRDGDGGMQGVMVMFNPVQLPEPSLAEKLASSVTDPLVAVDGEWRVCFANAAALRCLGNGIDRLDGKTWWDLLPTAVKELHGAVFEQALLRSEVHTAEVFVESSGAWHEVRSYPYPASGGRLLWLKDITTRKLEWERGNRLDRLESLGLLARGFAHDFNNLLTVLLGNLAMAEQRMKTAAPEAELRAARQATLLAQGLVQQLLTFARGGAPVKRGVSLAELVRHFFEQHPKLAAVDYKLEVGEGLPAVKLDPNQIRRLLGNLVRNAEQAMTQGQGGKLVLRCEAVDSASLYAHDVLKGEAEIPAGVVLEVEDNGEGIAAKHLPHVFEPYFTTRKKNNATGLGLTVCESIARAHGGTINIYATKPSGTRVRFFLPVEENEESEVDPGAGEVEAAKLGAPDAAQLGSTADAELKRSKPRILVLEDDHLVRALISRGLQAQGFEVTETVDGQDTVRLYEEALKERRPFDVVILDLSIPNGMGGVRTMEKLRGLDPQVLALVSSGYSDDPAMAQPSLYGFAAVLPKPYEPLELIQMVKRLLEERLKSGR